MKKPPLARAPRPFGLARRHPRTRPEAAAELVRLEYERDRLTRDLDMLEARRQQAAALLNRVDERVRRLNGLLSADDGGTR